MTLLGVSPDVVRAVLQRTLPVLAATVVLVPHARLYDFLTDDAYISFRYARNLAEHGELAYNLGERVEGFTNFLWTVLLALGIKLGASPVSLSRFLGVALAVGTLALVVGLARRLDGGRPSAWHFLAPLGLAVTPAYACWATGGLETQLFAFLVTLGFAALLVEVQAGRGHASGAVFALAAMTRPEGALLFGLAVAFRHAAGVVRDRRWRPRRHELLALALFAAIFIPYFLWRWRYYGWLFPNTFYVKSAGAAATGETWQLGFFYLRRFCEDTSFLFLFPLGLAGWPGRGDGLRRLLFPLVLALVLLFAVYVARVGGDFMGLHRFLVPLLPLAALVFQDAMRTLARRLRPRVGVVAPALAGIAIVGGYLAGAGHVAHTALTFVGADGGIDTPAYLKKYAEDRIPVGIWLGRHARPDDLMTVGGAGVIAYYSGIRAYDVFGLVDETIAHDPSMTAGTRPGHQKWGHDPYMLSRGPTLVTHHYCLYGPCGAEQWAPPGYEWVRAAIPALDPPYYSFMKRTDRAFGPFPAR